VAGLALPYDVAAFFAAMARYHAAWFPLPLVGLVLAVAALVLVVRPPAGRARLAARLIGLVLAAFALWVGAAHQLSLMATFNFMAPIYGWAWIAHGVVVAAVVGGFGGVRFAWRDRRDALGVAIALAGLVGYPLAVIALGHDARAAPLVGTAPDPTAVFTAGLALTARGRAAFALWPLPVAWAGVAALAAHLLAFPLGYAVAAAVVVALAGALARRGRGVRC
jgi:hypothetical protein